MSPSRTPQSKQRRRTARNLPAACITAVLASIALGLMVSLTGCMKSLSKVTPYSPAGRAARAAVPGSLPSLEEEVWIIARSRATAESPPRKPPGQAPCTPRSSRNKSLSHSSTPTSRRPSTVTSRRSA